MISLPANRWSPIVLSRIAGLSALAILVGASLYNGLISPPLGPPEPSSQQIATWVSEHEQKLLFQFVIGYIGLLYAVLIVLLAALSGRQGTIASLALIGAGANFAIGLVGFGLYFSLWTYLQRGESTGVVALFTAAESYTHAQLMAVGVAVGSVSALALISRTLPSWLAWFGLVMGAEHVVTYIVFASFPAFSTTTTVLTPGAVARISDLALEFLWLLAVGVTLLVRPVRSTSGATAETSENRP